MTNIRYAHFISFEFVWVFEFVYLCILQLPILPTPGQYLCICKFVSGVCFCIFQSWPLLVLGDICEVSTASYGQSLPVQLRLSNCKQQIESTKQVTSN